MRVQVLLLIVIFNVFYLVVHAESTSNEICSDSTSQDSCSKLCDPLIPACPCDKKEKKGLREAGYLILSNAKKFKTSNYKNNIIVIGVPQSGKTTLIKLLTIDNYDLLSKDKDGNLVIESKKPEKCDNNLIGNFIPEFYKERSSKTSWYVLPGLMKHKDRKINFAASYFSKKTFDTPKKIKILITIPFYKIVCDIYKEENLKVLIYLANILGDNIEDFNNSIALIATIVNNYDDNDDKLKNDIAQYILSLKDLICEKYLTKNEIKNLYKLIEIITIQNKKSEYECIGLVKTPTKVGRLNLDKPFQDAKRNLKKFIDKNFKFKSMGCIKTNYVFFDTMFYEKCAHVIQTVFRFITYFLFDNFA